MYGEFWINMTSSITAWSWTLAPSKNEKKTCKNLFLRTINNQIPSMLI